MEQLGLYPQYRPAEKTMNVTLHQFENALANMVASMYWGGIYFQFLGSSRANPAFVAANVQPSHWIQKAMMGGSDVHLPVIRGSALITITATHLNVCISSDVRRTITKHH